MKTENASAAGSLGQVLAGKYLTFALGREEYGLAILKVQEIIQMQGVTRIPRIPDYVRGVINLRGKVIPVIELRKKFGLEATTDTEKTCIIVVQVNGGANLVTMGLIIDEVKEVLDISADNIEDTPNFGLSINTEFIKGIGKIGDRVKMLLDIDCVLIGNEMNSVSQLAKAE